MNQPIPSYITSPRIREILARRWKDLPEDYRETPAECTAEDLPQLIRVATDVDLLRDDYGWEVGLLAWYELIRLGPEVAADALPRMLALMEDPWSEDYGWDEFRDTELPPVLAALAVDQIETLDAVLQDVDSTLDDVSLITASYRIMADRDPGRRDDIVDRTARALATYMQRTDEVNAYILGLLIDLKGVEAIDLIREVHHEDRVYIELNGDLEDVEIELGLRTERSTPRPHYGRPLDFDETLNLLLSDRQKQGPDREPIRREKKVGRNDPCPCGSGKKYKKCCLNRT